MSFKVLSCLIFLLTNSTSRRFFSSVKHFMLLTLKMFHFLITSIFKSLYFLKWCPIFVTSPLNQFSKFNNFLRVCWFLGKNLSNGQKFELPINHLTFKLSWCVEQSQNPMTLFHVYEIWMFFQQIKTSTSVKEKGSQINKLLGKYNNTV